MSDASGEEFLINTGVFERRSSARRNILGCIGCRWSVSGEDGEVPTFYGYQVTKCSDISPGSIYPVLDKLEEAGLMESGYEEMGDGFHGRPPRRSYHPSDSELGLEFKAIVSKLPESCGLDIASE